MTKFDYTRQDLEYALGKIGIGKGDRLFIHCNIGFLAGWKGPGPLRNYVIISCLC